MPKTEEAYNKWTALLGDGPNAIVSVFKAHERFYIYVAFEFRKLKENTIEATTTKLSKFMWGIGNDFLDKRTKAIRENTIVTGTVQEVEEMKEKELEMIS